MASRGTRDLYRIPFVRLFIVNTGNFVIPGNVGPFLKTVNKIMKPEHQLKTFLRILDEYSEDVPLTKFLPGFFRENKQMGSTDRKTASRLMYNYHRLGKALAAFPTEERLFIAEFLSAGLSTPLLEHFKPEFCQQAELPLEDKLEFLNKKLPEFKLEDVFPFTEHISEGIDKHKFLQSFFIQPDLFIRIHPGKETIVKTKLETESILFTEEGTSALRLPNGTKLDQIFPEQKPVEVQDLSSQKTGEYFKPQKYDYWWDACAASGGKSLLLFDEQPEIKLVVSDVRESVLTNLDERFEQRGLRKYQRKIIDLTQNPDPFLHDYAFDGIILDTPCTGSGTWGRTPEMISQFEERKILTFQRLQRTIAQNVVKYLKPGKPLIYITCSVFKEENEDNVEFLINEFGLKLESQEQITGYDRKADTMFVARLTRN